MQTVEAPIHKSRWEKFWRWFWLWTYEQHPQQILLIQLIQAGMQHYLQTTFQDLITQILLLLSLSPRPQPRTYLISLSLLLCCLSHWNLKEEQEGSHHTWPKLWAAGISHPCSSGKEKIFFFFLKHNCVLSVLCNWMIMKKMLALSTEEGQCSTLIPIGHMTPWGTQKKELAAN